MDELPLDGPVHLAVVELVVVLEAVAHRRTLLLPQQGDVVGFGVLCVVVVVVVIVVPAIDVVLEWGLGGGRDHLYGVLDPHGAQAAGEGSHEGRDRGVRPLDVDNLRITLLFRLNITSPLYRKTVESDRKNIFSPSNVMFYGVYFL